MWCFLSKLESMQLQWPSKRMHTEFLAIYSLPGFLLNHPHPVQAECVANMQDAQYFEK